MIAWLLGSGLVAGIPLVWWLARRALTRSDQRGDLREANARLEAALAVRDRTIADAGRALREKESEIERARTARHIAEEQRDEAIDDLAEGGDPRGTAARLRRDARRLSALAEAGLPAVPPGPSADRGDEGGGVHGAAEPADPGDGG